METDDLYREIDLKALKIGIAKQVEENERKIKEHFRRLQEQQKEIESQKRQLHSFVCDWQ